MAVVVKQCSLYEGDVPYFVNLKRNVLTIL